MCFAALQHHFFVSCVRLRWIALAVHPGGCVMSRLSGAVFCCGVCCLFSGAVLHSVENRVVFLSADQASGAQGGQYEDIKCYVAYSFGCAERKECGGMCESEAGWWFCLPDPFPDGPMPESVQPDRFDGSKGTSGAGYHLDGSFYGKACATCFECDCVPTATGRACRGATEGGIECEGFRYYEKIDGTDRCGLV